MDTVLGEKRELQQKEVSDVMVNYQIIIAFRDPETNEIIPKVDIIPVFLRPYEIGNWEITDDKFLKVAKSWLKTVCQRRDLKIDACLVYNPQGKRREELEPLLQLKE